MMTKFLTAALFMVILTAVISWQKDGGGSPAEANSKKSPAQDPRGEFAIGGTSSADHKTILRTDSSNPKQIRIVNHLESIAQVSPGLIARLNLALFDNNLEPHPGDWELLGLDKETSEVLSKDLKGIFQNIRENELSSFTIVEQSDNRVQISIPKFKPEDAAGQVRQIEHSYSKAFGPELSNLMAQLFIDSHSTIAAGVDGRDRVVTITATSDEVLSRTGRKYEIRTQVLYEGTKLSDAIGKLENYTQDNGIELVEEIPASWSHLFGNSD